MLPNKILITSPARTSERDSLQRTKYATGFERLKKQGFELIGFPTIKIIQSKNCKALDIAIQKINAYDYLLFTSKNSVDFFMQGFFAAGKTNKDLKGIQICAIGRKTAEEIKKWKIKVDIIPDEFNAEGLIKRITEEFKGKRNKGFLPHSPQRTRLSAGANRRSDKELRFLLPRAEKTRGIFPDKIKKFGAKIDMPVIYKIAKPEIDNKKIKKILNQKISVAAFTSASAFDNFTEMIGKKVDEFLKNTAIAVIGPVTAKAVRKAGFRVSIMPCTATIESMANEIIKWLKKNKKCACNR